MPPETSQRPPPLDPSTSTRRGERFVITRHNQPVAELIPFRQHDNDKVRAAIDGLKKFQRTHSLGDLSVRRMIEEGRRF